MNWLAISVYVASFEDLMIHKHTLRAVSDLVKKLSMMRSMSPLAAGRCLVEQMHRYLSICKTPRQC